MTRSQASPGALRRLLGRAGIEFHPGEAPAALRLFAAMFFCLSFQYAAKSVRQATFVDSFGAVQLPVVYLLVALLTYPLVRLYGRLSDRLDPARLVLLTCGLTAGGLVVFWRLYGEPWRWVPFVFYLWITVALALTLSQFWAYAATLFDSRQAKRLFGFVGAGALLGGAAGGQVARLSSELADTRAALLVGAGLLLVAGGLVSARHRRQQPEERAAQAERPAAGDLDQLRRSRHLRLVAGMFTLSIVVAQIVDLQFNWVVEQATTGLADRTAFFGNFYTITGLAAVVFQLAFTSRIHRGLGVGFALRVLPVTLIVGTTGLLLAAGFFPALLLASGLALKVGENGIRYSLDQVARELLLLPVARKLRARAKALIDVVVQRGAKGLAALLLLPVAFGWLSPISAGWASLLLIAVWLALVPAVYREYVRAYREKLREESADEGMPIDLNDVRTLEVLIQTLGSSDSRQVLHSLELLAAHGRGHLVPPLLLYHDDARVRRATLRVLGETRRDDAMPLVERRLSDQDPEVRAAAIRVLASLRHVDACSLMLPRLDEPNAAIRAAAIACVGKLGDPSMVERAGEALRDMLSDARPEIRREAARCLGAIPEPAFRDELLKLLYDRDTSVVREAIGSVHRRLARDGVHSLYLPTLISLLRDRRLKHDVREALLAFGEPVIPALLHFLNEPEEHVWVRRAIPKTLARLDTPAATRALVENLGDQPDPFLRRKMIEALGSARGRDPLAPIDRPVTAEARVEAVAYLQTLADLDGLGDDQGEQRDLLSRLLHERLDDHLRNMFGLLALLFPPEPIRAAHLSVASGAPTRTDALEYLDNTLGGELRKTVLAVIEDRPLVDKLVAAERTLGVQRRDGIEVLRSCLDSARSPGPDGEFLTAAALYRIYTERRSALYPEVERLAAEATDPFVQETAGWVSARLATEVERPAR